jgi:hypothetical protein
MSYTAEAYYRADQPNEPVIIASTADLDTMIADLLGQPPGHTFATVYIRERPFGPAGFPDHELAIGVDAHTGTGVLIYSGPNGRRAAGSYVSHNPTEHRTTPRVYHHFHLEQAVPAESDIPLDGIRRAAYEFVTTGGRRPGCIRWQPYTDRREPVIGR